MLFQLRVNRRSSSGHTRGVSKLLETSVGELSPQRIALLLDVDGTLAPIVENPEDAAVPLETRHTLVELARRLGIVSCVSGRAADDARRVVGVAGITYIGSHGSELLEPGMPSPESDPRLDLWSAQVGELGLEASRELAAVGVRREDKGSIVALHWRGSNNQEAARLGLIAVADKAVAQGLAIHWGRKVLELRPPIAFDKGRAIERLIQSKVDQGYAFDLVIFAGDDLTDLDAFAAVRRMSDAETVGSGVCIAVTSSEVPQALVAAADLQLDSPEAMSQLLDRLLAELLQ